MSQNRSSAVMQQRASPRESLDFFPTPPWATRALLNRLAAWWPRELHAGLSCWEPACGDGAMASVMPIYFRHVFASDIADYGFGEVEDFLAPSQRQADWIITNPPFSLAMPFALQAVARARFGVALLVRSAFLEGMTRHERLFTKYQPWRILQFVERVPMVVGRLDRKASTATAYMWIIWLKHRPDRATGFDWIGPCRKELELDRDYTQRPT